MSQVRFSVQTPLEGTTFEALARHWQRAEELGYDTVWLDDHFYGVVTPASDDSLECWTLMAALARETSPLRFGTLVLCNNYRQPTLVAKMASTLDHSATAGSSSASARAGTSRSTRPTATTSRRSARASRSSTRRWRSARACGREERATFAAGTTGSSAPGAIRSRCSSRIRRS